MTDWTPEAIVAHYMSEIAALSLGKCPASGEPLVYDNPHSEAPRYRLSCDMCDCFGYWTPKREA
jgi:hypothetical protein